MFKKTAISSMTLLLLSNTGTAGAAALEEITVTAQKREQSLSDVPISVAAVSGEEITRSGFSRLDELSEFTPNLTITESFTGSQIVVRGVGTSPGNAGFEQSVSTFIDGVYFGRERSSVAAFLDVDRVEVLRGPQPTYFGQNAIAGAINISTRRPTDEAEGYVNLSFGTDDEYSATAAYGGPITEKLLARVALRANGMDGYINDPNNGDLPERESKSGRVIFTYLPTDNMEISLKYEQSESEQSGHTLQPDNCNADTDGDGVVLPYDPFTGTGDPTVPCDFALKNVPGYSVGTDNTLYNGGHLAPPPGFVLFLNLAGTPVVDASQLDFFQQQDRNLDTSNAAFSFEYDFGNVILNSITGYVEYESDFYLDLDETPYALVHPYVFEDFEQTSQELRLTSAYDSRLEWMAGVYYQDHELKSQNELTTAHWSPGAPIAPGPMGAITIGQHHNEDSEWLSFFMAGTYSITDALRLELGLRYTEVEKEGSIRAIDGGLTCGGMTCFPGQVATERVDPSAIRGTGYDADFEDDDVNPTLGLQWDFNNDVMLYARYAEAFKAGGFNAGNSVPSSEDLYVYDSEHAETIELGAKMTLLEGALALNVALFTTEYTDLQTNAFVQDTGSFDVTNAGEATSEGIEFDGGWAVTDNFTLTFSGSVMNAEYDSYEGAACNDSERASGACVNGTIDRAGYALKLSPDWSLSVGGDYTIPLSDRFELNLAASVYATDDYGNSELFTTDQDAYQKVNATVSLRPTNGHWEVSVYARNIGDEQVVNNTGPGALNGWDTIDQEQGRGDSYGVILNYQF